MTITCFLAQSPRTDRWYYTANSFNSGTMVGLDGESFTYLSPVGNNDLRNLDDDAITSAILPIEWNDLSRDEVLTMVPSTASMNTKTGELSF